MRATEGVLALYRQRVADRSGAHEGMQMVRDIVNGDAELPSAELSPDEKAAAPDLITLGGEQMAMRTASVLPDLSVPPVNPASRRSVERASEARRALLGMWEANDMAAIAYKRALHLFFDGETPVVVEPDFSARKPKWDVVDPISAYPPPVTGLSPIVDDCIFTYRQTFAWLRVAYPWAAAQMPRTARMPDATVLLLKYYDDEDCVLIAVGESYESPATLYQIEGGTAAFPTPAGPDGMTTSWSSQAAWYAPDFEYVELRRYPHGLGLCPVVYPTRITLDRLMGQFTKLVPLFVALARMMAMTMIGVDRSILKETWVTNTVQGKGATIVNQADARSGKVGEIIDGKLDQFGPDPGFMSMPMLDRLTEAIRWSGGIPPEFGGASQANIRTGRRGENILSAAIDFPIAQAQLALARSMQAELQVAIAIAKRWWGNRDLSVYVNWRGARGPVTYRPSKVFESDRVLVNYALVGVDAAQAMVLTGQRLGLKLVSRAEARRRDVGIDDPEQMALESDIEALDDAFLAGLQQRVTQLDAGGIPLEDLLRIRELRAEGKELVAAYRTAQREAQERQAQQAEQGAPETQPGIEPPGIGNTQPAAAPPQNDLQDIVGRLRLLRGAQMTSPAERAATPVGGAA
jgi:hypothetical protein